MGNPAVIANKTVSSGRNTLNKGVALCGQAVSRYRLLLLALALALITSLVAGCGPKDSGSKPKPSRSATIQGY
jgi:hypothetical protein